MSAIKNLMTKFDVKISIAIVGIINSGKTEFVKRILQSAESIGASVSNTTEFELQTLDNFSLLTWDLGEHIPQKKSLWKRSILGANALLFFVDSTNRDIFQQNKKLIKDLVELNFPIRILVLGSKSDLPNSASVGELMTGLGLMELDKTKCDVDLYKFSSKTGEGLYAIEEWLNRILFKRRERVINYNKIAACVTLCEESGEINEAVLTDTPNLTLLATLRELRRKVTIFSRTMRVHGSGEEVIEIANFKIPIVKEHRHIVAMVVGPHDSVPRAMEISRSVLKIIAPYCDKSINLVKIIRDLYPLDVTY
jgi:GTPase SAR1 family protein